MTERMIQANGVELCAESFGEPTDPPVLLVMGIGASMLWWEDELCRMLAGRGRFVLRYDHRDTGRSVTCEPGRPDYSGADLTDDARGVLDAYDLAAAHIVGVSAGAGIGQELALDHPQRVLSLVLISSSPAVPGDRRLPGPNDEIGRFVSTAEVDWADERSVIEYQLGYARMLAGSRRPFDEASVRDLVRRDAERAVNYAAVRNHDLIHDGDDRPYPPLSSITAPTLVVHGTADPMFPIEHGEALAHEIPGARLLRLDGAGHGLQRQDWPIVADAVIDHTATPPPRRPDHRSSLDRRYGMSNLGRITSDPAICHGQPTVRGLRYPVEMLLELLAGGMTIDEILEDYADLERDDLLAAFEFGALAAGRRVIPLGAA